MDERDTIILFDYLDKLTKAVDRMSKQLELTNLPPVVTCDNNKVNSHCLDWDNCIRHVTGMPEQRNEETK